LKLGSTPRVSVIVPARDAAATLPRTLRCLAAQDLAEPFEVIVVDAGSVDATASIAEASEAPVRLARWRPAGPAEARNRGVEIAHGTLLAFTDADCFPRPGWLSAGVRALDGATLVQGRVVPDARATRGPFDRTIAVESDHGLFETANLFVRRQALERVGGFESWLRPTIGAPHMAEDVLLGWRVRRLGEPTAFCAGAEVEHAVFPRGALTFAAERRRLRYFADIAEAVPELRAELFFLRLFLSRHSAAFDLALAGVAAAIWRRSPSPLAAVLPYLRMLRRASRGWGARSAEVAAATAMADAVGAYSLVLGSVRRRTLLL
jgi:glycosyltransferase involved in cell wall biosynthesis